MWHGDHSQWSFSIIISRCPIYGCFFGGLFTSLQWFSTSLSLAGYKTRRWPSSFPSLIGYVLSSWEEVAKTRIGGPVPSMESLKLDISIKPYMHMLRSSFPWKRIWRTKATKSGFFVWTTTQEKILTLENLRGVCWWWMVLYV